MQFQEEYSLRIYLFNKYIRNTEVWYSRDGMLITDYERIKERVY